MQVPKIKAAVVGCGIISDIYIQSLSKRFEIIDLVACTDLDVERARQQAQQYNLKAMLFQDILTDSSIEMIINLTNPGAHFSINKQAIEHGKHVFSEKMMAVELAEGKELCRRAKKNNVYFGVAPDTFLGGSVQTARYIVDKGLIGEPLSALVSLNKDFNIYGDILPHLHKRGGGIAFDSGCYYMTALASILGPVEKVSSFARLYQPERISKRVDKPWFGESIRVEDENIVASALKYKSGVLATVHFVSESILYQKSCLEIYGTEGILIMGDPNEFGSPVYIKKTGNEIIRFPFTHGYTEDSRGLGAAEMAWSILKKRPHRASMEMAYHILELLHGMIASARNERIYQMQSEFSIPEPLQEGYLDSGGLGAKEESSLV